MIKRIFDIPSRIFLEFHKELNNLWNPTHQKSKSNLTCFLPFLTKDWLLSSRGDAEKKKPKFELEQTREWILFYLSRHNKFKKKGKKKREECEEFILFAMQLLLDEKKKEWIIVILIYVTLLILIYALVLKQLNATLITDPLYNHVYAALVTASSGPGTSSTFVVEG